MNAPDMALELYRQVLIYYDIILYYNILCYAILCYTKLDCVNIIYIYIDR